MKEEYTREILIGFDTDQALIRCQKIRFNKVSAAQFHVDLNVKLTFFPL
jgi:hypothetical protein